MDTILVDRLAKLFADRRLSRRQALTQGTAGLAAGAIAATGLGAAHAQDATPAAGANGEKVQYLFVQSFQSGTVEPKAGDDNTFTLTLEQGLGQTIYFSDRPERIVGTTPTPELLEGLGFVPENPPNAALVVETAAGDTEIAVLELTNPTYDTTTNTATYDVQVLAEWEAEMGIGLAETPADLAELGDSFGAAHLFIDDCPDWSGCWVECNIIPKRHDGTDFGPVGACWSWTGSCDPGNCGDYTDYNAICQQKHHGDVRLGCYVYAGV